MSALNLKRRYIYRLCEYLPLTGLIHHDLEKIDNRCTCLRLSLHLKTLLYDRDSAAHRKKRLAFCHASPLEGGSCRHNIARIPMLLDPPLRLKGGEGSADTGQLGYWVFLQCSCF